MPIVQICDADGETVLKDGEAVSVGWGRKRVYSAHAAMVVDAYYHSLQKAALAARKVFEAGQEEARKEFLSIYPNGKLPDDPDD